MTVSVEVKHYAAPPIDRAEIWRYAGCRSTPDAALTDKLEWCLQQAQDSLVYRACLCTVPLTVQQDGCVAGPLFLPSKGLARHLQGCDRAVLFAATVGPGIDRLITRYSRIEPSAALRFQAIGAERIEALCDAVCADAAQAGALRSRFSPGYGDLPLSCQTELFSLLGCARHIGLTLGSSLLMSPTKSVTAVVGIQKQAKDESNVVF